MEARCPMRALNDRHRLLITYRSQERDNRRATGPRNFGGTDWTAVQGNVVRRSGCMTGL